jgi:hypothetical protein
MARNLRQCPTLEVNFGGHLSLLYQGSEQQVISLFKKSATSFFKAIFAGKTKAGRNIF